MNCLHHPIPQRQISSLLFFVSGSSIFYKGTMPRC